MAKRPKVLIEQWLPVDVIGAESMRERGASSALPPLYFLHVWWARRPLTTSRAAILASVLPAWSEDWPERLLQRFPTEAGYRAWFLEACGIFGDPVAGRKLIAWAKEHNVKLKGSPYTHRRAFTLSPSPEVLETVGDLLGYAWGSRTLSVLDSFAGGGSIPFEAMRYGFDTYANELNPVATVILKATLEYPAVFGPELAQSIRRYGDILAEQVRKRLEPFFPVDPGESVHAYIWARTVSCPYTGKPIPLSPNWWVQKGSDPVAVRPIFDPDASEATFEIVRGEAACERLGPEAGTVRGGNAISPWSHNQPVDGDYIKAEAQAGRVGRQLYGIALKKKGGFAFRTPYQKELDAVHAAEEECTRRLPEWTRLGLVPTEDIGEESNYDRGHRLYGIRTWQEAFAPRQLLAAATILEVMLELADVVRNDLPKDRAEAVITYLALAFDKGVDYNSGWTRWDSTRDKVVNTFDKHNFAFVWSHPEFDAARNLVPWVVDQVGDAYDGLAKLSAHTQELESAAFRSQVSISMGSATSVKHVPSRSVALVCVDPPYYGNVMYAECSDFFYVWMKRTLGTTYPELFSGELTDKDDEAVANPARFASMGKKKQVLAKADYERKMAAAFREMHRVLRDDGVLTVMFTHKEVEAWDALATSLIGAAFSIQSSWPVHTESEHSIHQAKKNAAQSTILLTCRKREASNDPVWWDDLKGTVRRTAREKAAEFEAQGIRGVDLYIATFGPTLSILSENWPVLTSEADLLTGEPKPLRPEVALDLAREEVVALRKQGLLLGRSVQFDPFTDWYLMAWDAFQAEEFPGDEARKLALALGLDLEREVIAQKRLVAKKSANVVLQQPGARRKHDGVDPDARSFDSWIDTAHTAMLLYKEEGAQSCRHFLLEAGLLTDATFKALLQALLNAIPRTTLKGKFVRPEAETLEAMRLAFFDDLEAPPEEKPPTVGVQLGLLDEPIEEPEDDEDEGEDES